MRSAGPGRRGFVLGARAARLLAAFAAFAAFAGAAPARAGGRDAGGGALEVTTGAVAPAGGDALRVDVPEFRAVLPGTGGDAATLRFRYLGPTADRSRLASGEERRQLGLKLRARDGCNLVYVMWRMGRAGGIAVSVKSNPRGRTHADCGARGYRAVRPDRSAPAPELALGERHVLSARIAGEELSVEVDGRPVWRGRLPGEASALRGPVGVRSDNVRFEFELEGAP